jgi:hypothetical protein
MQGTILLVLLMLVVVPVVIMVSYQWEHDRSRNLIAQWAAENRYELLAASRQYWTLGTPFWFTAKGQTVYRIEARDYQGNTYTGYALCGGRFMGLWSDRVEVKWDKPPYEQWKEKPKFDVEKRKNEEYSGLR